MLCSLLCSLHYKNATTKYGILVGLCLKIVQVLQALSFPHWPRHLFKNVYNSVVKIILE